MLPVDPGARWSGRCRRAIAVVPVLVCLLFLLVAPAGAATSTTTVPAVDPLAPKAWILVDADTGKVIDGLNPHEPHLTASTIKLLTALTVTENVPADATLTVSARAASMPSMRIGMIEGQVWPVRDALASLMLVSANDAAFALAEKTSGSAEAFNELATATAKRIGMKDTTVGDPAGLDDRGGKSMASPYDLAVAARNVMVVPELSTLAATAKAQFVDPAGQTRYLTNHNDLLTKHPYAGVTGMKTGFTKAAGRTLVASATRDGRTMIAVVMDVYDQYGWVTTLMDRGFATPVAQEPPDAEVLPEAAVLPVDTRALIAGGLPSLLGAPRPLATGATLITSTTTAPPTTTTATTTAATTTANATERAATPAATTASSDDGLSAFEWLIILLVLLTVAFFARRAQINARRRKRRAGRRALALAKHGGPRAPRPTRATPPSARTAARRAGPTMPGPRRNPDGGGTRRGHVSVLDPDDPDDRD